MILNHRLPRKTQSAVSPRTPNRARESGLALIASIALLSILGACQTSGGPALSEIARDINSTLEPAAVVLGIGDTLDVRFPYSPTWNQEVAITDDGSASFMAIGRLIVAGSSLGQLNATLTESYSHVFENHELDVVLKSRGARKIFVMGEVTKPGEFELDPDRRVTLLDAVARAGGPRKESAYLAHTLLVRWSATNRKQLSWTIDAREEFWTGPEPVYLQPYDLVYIPNTPIDRVGIWVDNYIRRLIPVPYLIPPVR